MFQFLDRRHSSPYLPSYSLLSPKNHDAVNSVSSMTIFFQVKKQKQKPWLTVKIQDLNCPSHSAYEYTLWSHFICEFRQVTVCLSLLIFMKSVLLYHSHFRVVSSQWTKRSLAEQQSCEFSIINYYYYVFICTEAGLYFAYTCLS